MDGGFHPPFRTSRYLPSGESADDIGKVSSGICVPAGSRRHPLLSRKPPPASGPTCSGGAGCELRSTARKINPAAKPSRLVGLPGNFGISVLLLYDSEVRPGLGWLPYEFKRLANEFHFHAPGDEPGFETQIEQFLRGLANLAAGVQRVMVDIHADEFFGQAGLQVARELHGVFERRAVIVQGVLNAFAHHAAAFHLNFAAERTQQHIGAERQWEPVGILEPVPQTDHAVESPAPK